ncbi:hypothetical protein ECAE60S_04475 [Eoetvoesiella caeni]
MNVVKITPEEVTRLLELDEDHFNDVKSKR